MRPLNRALEGAQGWITGLRREQSDARADVPLAAWDAERGLIKVNPIADWSTETLRPTSPPTISRSIRCTRRASSRSAARRARAPSQPGEDPRAGRWWWENEEKKECGLHANPSTAPTEKEKAA